MAAPFQNPLAFTEALDAVAGRQVTPSAFRTAEWAGVDVEIRQRAFFSAGVESAGFLDRSREFILDYLAKTIDPATGGLKAQGRQQFVRDMREFAIREGLGRVDPTTGTIDPVIRESDLRDLRSIARLQLIFDTQVESAMAYGYWRQGLSRVNLATFPAQRFIRIRPVLTPRPYHAANENVVKLKTDIAFWLDMNRDFNVPWGPWGFNSGMGVEDVSRREAIALGLLRPDEKLDPAPLMPYNAMMQASAARLSTVSRANLRRAGLAATPPANQPAPASPTVNPRQSTATPGSTPVGNALKDHQRSTRKEKAVAKEAVDTIALVHGDGTLPDLPVRFGSGTKGHYNGREIKVGKSAGHQLCQAVHEIGHFLDHRGVPGAGFTSESLLPGDMDAVMTAIRASAAYTSLRDDPDYQRNRKYRRYQMKSVELWARAYTQFIAEESGHLDMQAELQKRREGKTGYWKDSQWEASDFAPIRTAIRDLFVKLNWMKP